MKRTKFLLGAILAVSVSILASCGGDNNGSSAKPSATSDIESFNNSIVSNMTEVYSITSNAVMLDGGAEVYKNDTRVVVNDKNTLSGSVSVDKYTLNKSFKLEKRTTVTSFSNLDSSKLFTYQLNNNYFTEYTIDNGVLFGKVKTESAGLFFNDSTLTVTGTPTFTFTLTDEKLSALSISYVSDGKTVTINSSYVYY